MILFLHDSGRRETKSDPLSLAGGDVNRSKIGHIPALDGIRGVAILLVLICHFIPGGEATKHGVGQILARIAILGWTGVDLFFVLSGFLITGILLRSKPLPRYFVNFYGRRVLRIFPLYYFVLAVVAIGLFTIPSWSSYDKLRTHWASYWFYATNFICARHGWAILAEKKLDLTFLWSLAVEEHFYLFWPLMVWLFSERSLTRACVAMIVIAPILRWLSPYLGQQDIAPYALTQCRMDSLATGALLAVMVHYRSPAEVLRRLGWIGLISAILWLAYVVQSVRIHGYAAAPFRVGGHSILAFMFAGMICLALMGGWTAAMMTWRPLRFFGVYSYGIYIYHGILQAYLLDWFIPRRFTFHTGHIWVGILPHYFLCIAVPTLIAVVSYHLMEKQFLKLKRFF
jgi:peptidoglycan/LPS O-acetylase OafA/YrhL